MTMWRLVRPLALCAALGGLLGACDTPKAAVYPDKDKSESAARTPEERKQTPLEALFAKRKQEPEAIAVNVYLWRASLDTVSFMPIASADPFGGTIISDWFQLPEAPGARFKLTVFILDRVLRADGVRVAVFKQSKDASGQWVDAKVDPKMSTDIENAILTRARQLRIAAAASPQ